MTLVRELRFPLVAVLCAFLVGGLVVLAIGENPFDTSRLLLGAAFSWPDGIGYTLFYATPLVFTGLAVAVAMRCGLLNIGAEGQLYVAAFATAWIGIEGATLPAAVLLPLCALTAVAAGAAWGAIPGILKARFGSHEVINTIMLNFIAVALVSYFTQYHYKMAGDPIMQSAPIGEGAHLLRLGRLVPGLPERIPLNLAFLLALGACALVYVFLWKTTWGYELRATGQNPAAAEYGGVSIGRQIIVAMAISGGLAGMVGINEVLGYRYRYYDGFSDNYGFTGIAVALLGRNHPAGVLAAALLFAVLQRGGVPVDAFTEHVSKDIVQILQALVILFVAAEAMFPAFLASGARVMGDVLSIALIFSTIRLATPLVWAAIGGLYAERAGVINIALEGLMLAGAFTAAAVTYYAGSPWAGLAAAMGAGALVAALLAVVCIRFHANEVVAGTGINILFLGLPAVLSGALFLSSGSTPQIPQGQLVPAVGEVSVLSLLAVLVTGASAYALYRTPFGLRLRAVGENPEAADAGGVRVLRIRYTAVVLSGVLAAVGGAYLSIGQSSLFTRNMTAGRGFIALAALIFGKWRPIPTMLACLLFGFADAVTIQMQGVVKLPSGEDVPVQFVQIIPYVVTIVVQAGFIGRSRAPGALGQPYLKER